MITKPSPHSIAVTIDRLEAALKAKGIAIAVRLTTTAIQP
jgi:hypothetical protein